MQLCLISSCLSDSFSHLLLQLSNLEIQHELELIEFLVFLLQLKYFLVTVTVTGIVIKVKVQYKNQRGREGEEEEKMEG